MSEAFCLEIENRSSIPFELIGSQLNRDQHVILRFKELSQEELMELTSDLSELFPDCMVFKSRPGLTPISLTIKMVITLSEIAANISEFAVACQEYELTSRNLVEKYKSGNLDELWDAQVHGEHIRFENLKTHQIVEAPREWQTDSLESVDPMFYGIYLKTTSKHHRLGEMIQSEYHDGCRILERISKDNFGR